MSVKIFVMTHKRFEVPGDPMYIPLHVGHKDAREELGYLGDDTGDNISERNGYYAELSGVYWVWKNCHDADCIGVCHYRRFLISEEGYAFSAAEYEEILRSYDIITTKQLKLPGSYRNGFAAHHNVGALDETGRIIAERFPEYHDTFVRLVQQDRTYFGNIMAARRPLYCAYCEWLFAILFELQGRIDLTFADDYHKRIFGFISEFLLYVWVTARKLNAFECRVAVIGEKKETSEVLSRMAVFFRERDAAGARRYLEAVLEKRPDIIMEASDINGECKRCLQAVSTADLELSEYGRSFLDEINGYQQIMDYFRELDCAAARAVGLAESGEGVQGGSRRTQLFPWTTEAAKRVAVRLYAKDQETAERALRLF